MVIGVVKKWQKRRSSKVQWHCPPLLSNFFWHNPNSNNQHSLLFLSCTVCCGKMKKGIKENSWSGEYEWWGAGWLMKGNIFVLLSTTREKDGSVILNPSFLVQPWNHFQSSIRQIRTWSYSYGQNLHRWQQHAYPYQCCSSWYNQLQRTW